MSGINAIFIFNEQSIIMQCSLENTLEEICQNYATKINKNINSFIFLYGGKQVNFDLPLKNLINPFDRETRIINILVYENNGDILICPKCNNKIEIKTEKFDDIIFINNEINGGVNGIQYKIENMDKSSLPNNFKNDLNNITKTLNVMSEDIQKNNDIIKSILNKYSSTNNKITKKIENTKTINESIINDNKNKKVENNIITKKQEYLKDKTLFMNLKSKNIYRIIFSYMDEKAKLKTIKYNKNLQNKIDISLNNFDDLIFEGEYSNEKRNGKGKNME